jgi:hypothetical protein
MYMVDGVRRNDSSSVPFQPADIGAPPPNADQGVPIAQLLTLTPKQVGSIITSLLDSYTPVEAKALAVPMAITPFWSIQDGCRNP